MIDVKPQRCVIGFCDCGDLAEAVEIASHHHGNEGDWNAKAAAAGGLFMDERPVTGATLGVLLSFMGVIEGEFNFMECP